MLPGSLPYLYLVLSESPRSSQPRYIRTLCYSMSYPHLPLLSHTLYRYLLLLIRSSIYLTEELSLKSKSSQTENTVRLLCYMLILYIIRCSMRSYFPLQSRSSHHILLLICSSSMPTNFQTENILGVLPKEPRYIRKTGIFYLILCSINSRVLEIPECWLSSLPRSFLIANIRSLYLGLIQYPILLCSIPYRFIMLLLYSYIFLLSLLFSMPRSFHSSSIPAYS